MLFNSIGYIGALLYLLGYFLLSMRKIHGNSHAFQLFNLLGAFGVTIAALYNHDKPSILLNVCWGLIALSSLLFLHNRKKK